MVFPAHAGVIPVSKTWRKHARSFSRTRGGDPKRLDNHDEQNKFFPHSRGWSLWQKAMKLDYTVFPALAGVILSVEIWYQINLCFSRTRGGDPSSGVFEMSPGTFFPHTRGWSWCIQTSSLVLTVFPAHAGVIPLLTCYVLQNRRFSRTRGGDPTQDISSAAIVTFFPHTRGWSRWCK